MLSENKPIRLEFSRNVKVKHPEHLIFRSSLLFCNEDDAPEVFNTSKHLYVFTRLVNHLQI